MGKIEDLRDPILHDKLKNHPDYMVPPDLPPKPTNTNQLSAYNVWIEKCDRLAEPSWKHNGRLLLKIQKEHNEQKNID